MADLWSDYTDALMKDIDKSLGSKYKMSIQNLLADPTKYVSQPNVQLTVGNMKEDANKYIDGLLGGMPDEVKALEDSTAKANEMTRQLAQNISMQTKQHDVPLVKPYDVTREPAREEVIQIDTVDDQLLKLAEKLTEGSNMVADFTYSFKNFNIGSWLFSRNEKNYVLSVYMPPNNAYDLELSRLELNDLFDDAANFIRG